MHHRKTNSKTPLATKMSDAFNLTMMVPKIENMRTLRAGVGDSAKYTEDDSDEDYIEDIFTFCKYMHLIS